MIELAERPVSILLVDDDPGRSALATRLTRASDRYKVYHVLALEEALEILAHKPYDIVLCDYYLEKGHTAKELVAAVVRPDSATRVVVFSAYAEGEFKEEVLQAGAFWYLTKPIVFSELLHTVQTIEAFRREKELSQASSQLAEISTRFHSTLQLDEVSRKAVQAALELGFRRARVYLIDEKREYLVGQASAGMPPGSFESFKIRLSGSGLIDRIFSRREPTALSFEISKEYCKPPDLNWIADVGLEEVPWLDCPLLVGEQRVGTLAVDCKGADYPHITPQQKDIANVLSGLVAQAVNNCRLYQAEALAKASLRQILLEAPDAVVTTTMDGTIDFVSFSAESIFGLPASAIVGRKAADFYLDEAGALGAGTLMASSVMNELREGRLVNRRVYIASGPEGRPLPLSLSASLLHDPKDHGEPIGTLGFLKTLGYLEQQYEEYTNLLAGFGYGTVILAEDGSISYINPKAERLLGGPGKDLVGKPLKLCLRERYREGLEKHLRDLRSPGESTILAVEAELTTGEFIPLELSLSAIRVRGGLQGFAVGLYDRREQERLIWTGRLVALGEMVGALAHEINNPLNNILTAIGILEKLSFAEAAGGDPRAILRTISNGVRRIAALVQRLRRLSRNEPSTQSPMDLTRLVEEFREFFARRLAAEKIELQISASRPAYILGDPVQIEQVLTSLVVNAQEAMEGLPNKRLRIEVRVNSEAGRAELVVEDSGRGVEKEHQAEIFDLFFTTKHKQGTGFGLSISRAIASEHRGELRLEAPTAGQGARFVLSLPVLGLETKSGSQEVSHGSRQASSSDR